MVEPLVCLQSYLAKSLNILTDKLFHSSVNAIAEPEPNAMHSVCLRANWEQFFSTIIRHNMRISETKRQTVKTCGSFTYFS